MANGESANNLYTSSVTFIQLKTVTKQITKTLSPFLLFKVLSSTCPDLSRDILVLFLSGNYIAVYVAKMESVVIILVITIRLRFSGSCSAQCSYYDNHIMSLNGYAPSYTCIHKKRWDGTPLYAR